MKGLTALLLSLILVVLLVVAYFLFQLTNKSSKDVKEESKSKTETSKTIEKVDKSDGSSKMGDEPTQPPVQKKVGKVTGKLCYPSEGIPPLTVYLKNNSTGDWQSLDTAQNQATYTFDDVPAGSYIAFAYPKSYSVSGSFSPAVPCGLTVSCTDHKPTVFNVEGGKTTSGIDICDWYGNPGDVPPKP